MAHHRRSHRRLPRNPDFWSDIGDRFRNSFGFDDDDSNSGGSTTRNNNGGNDKIRRQDDDDDEPTSTRRRADRQGRSTVIRTIYQTVTDGAVAAATTSPTRLIVAPSFLPTRRITTSSESGTTIARAGGAVAVTPDASTSTTSSTDDATTELPSVIEEPLTESIQTTLAIATGAPTLALSTRSAATANEITAVSSPSATATAASDKSTTEPSGAAKAGIAIGVLAGALVVFLLVFFLFNRRKKQLEQQRLADEDEKSNFGTAMAVTAGNNPLAPRVSLRPVTQFLPNLNLDKRQSAWERPVTGQSAKPANPFGSGAERINGPIAEETASTLSLNEKPLPSVAQDAPVGTAVGDSPAPATNGAAVGAAVAAGAAAAGAGAAAAGALVRKASTRKDGPKALDLTLPAPAPLSTVPASPCGTEFSANSAGPGHESTDSTGSAAIAAAGGPANTTVHRVQLDFKPTLEDEMELRAGQLVRLLHEYDDGWALCIRLDRSQQGVVPRTCLSTRPVKPRLQGPQGPPRGAPMGPNGPNGPNGPHRGPGPNYPPGHRPMTPQSGPYPRPESPARPRTAGGRPQSPAGHRGPGGRPQSPSPRFQGPPGPTIVPQPNRMNLSGHPAQQGRPGPPMRPVGRKPVPGQTPPPPSQSPPPGQAV